MNQAEILTLLNNAGRDELVELPGVGPVLAERIIAARPYDSLEAVPAVKGVSAGSLERWMASAADAPQPDPEPAPGAIEDGPVPEADTTGASNDQSPLDGAKDAVLKGGQALGRSVTWLGGSVRRRGRSIRQAAETLPERLDPATRSWGASKTIVVSSIIAALVAILLTLAVLGGVNGSLKYATSSEYHANQAAISSLTAQVDTLRQDLDGLRGRVDVLEGMGERIVVLERAQQQLTSDQEAVGRQVSAMQTEVTALNSKVEQQEERTQRFETFLKDLQTLLGGLFTQGVTQ